MMSKTKAQPQKRRDKGEGSIWYNEEKKRWYAQLSLGFDDQGKKVRKTVSALNKSEVILKMRDVIRGDNDLMEIRSRHQISPVNNEQRSQVLMKDYIKTYLNLYKRPTVTPKTFEWCVNVSKHIIRGLGDYDMNEINSLQIQKFLNNLAAKSGKKKALSRVTIKGILMILRQTFEFAEIQNDIDENPFHKRIVTPKPESALNEIPKAIPTDTLLEVFKAVETSGTFSPIVYTLFYTGIRIGELLALKWEDLDEENGLIHIKRSLVKESIINEELKTTERILTVTKTKTNTSVRIIPVDKKLFEVLNELKKRMLNNKMLQRKLKANQTSAYIFVNNNGELRSYDGLRRQFARLLEEKGVSDRHVTFHRFRHTYATLLIENGTNPRVVQELLGHKDVETTLSIYTSVSIESMTEAAKDFGEIALGVIGQKKEVKGNNKTYIL